MLAISSPPRFPPVARLVEGKRPPRLRLPCSRGPIVVARVGSPVLANGVSIRTGGGRRHRKHLPPTEEILSRAESLGSSGGGHAELGLPSSPSTQGSGRLGPDYSHVTRNLALELVRVTEAAALGAAEWLGKGDKIAADQAAVDAMRQVLGTISMDGVVVIGEGEKDEAPMLYRGEVIGDGRSPRVEIAVDPLDGTTLCAKGMNGAISVLALAERGALFDPGPAVYMEKLAVGPEAAGRVHLGWSVAQNLQAVAAATGKEVSELVVVMLDRPRHAHLLQQCREAGAHVKLISDGDVAASIAVATPGHNCDMLLGIGGTPEGIISACALKCLGGEIQGRLWPRDEAEREAIQAAGYDISKILTTDDLAAGEEIFFAATGVSDGDFLQGVRFHAGGAETNSLVMRTRSGTVRKISTAHRWDRAGATNPRASHS